MSLIIYRHFPKIRQMSTNPVKYPIWFCIPTKTYRYSLPAPPTWNWSMTSPLNICVWHDTRHNLKSIPNLAAAINLKLFLLCCWQNIPIERYSWSEAPIVILSLLEVFFFMLYECIFFFFFFFFLFFPFLLFFLFILFFLFSKKWS